MSLIRTAALIALLVPQSAPDLSGHWTLNPALSSSSGGGNGRGAATGGGRGGGLGLGPSPDQLVIRQDATSITIEEHRGADVATLVLGLNRQMSRRTIPAGQHAGTSATSVTLQKGDRFVTVVSFPSAEREDARETFQEVRYLSNGNLVVEITQPGRPNSRTSVYSRAKRP